VSEFEDAIGREKAKLVRIDDHAARSLTRAYRVVLARMNTHLKALTRQIETATAQGVEVRPGWLFAQDRYRSLISDLEDHSARFAGYAHTVVRDGKQRAVEVAVPAAERLTLKALGPAPREALARVRGLFDRVSTAALDRIVNFAGDGRPLGMLLAELAPGNVQGVRDALALGVATGQSPRVIAKDVAAQAHVPLTRALAISRTEIVRAHREASSETHRATGIVRTWVWHADPGPRSCAVCVAMHGTEHPIDATLDSHVACRCAKVPRTPSWEELGFHGIPDQRPSVTPGAVLFGRLPESDRLAVLGRPRLDAYERGDITLADLVRGTRSARWGAGRRVASLAELGI